MIAIVDYGLGNVQAFANIYKRLNVPVIFARTSEELEGASHIVLPGVGAFDCSMERLNASGMRSTLDQLVLDAGRPVLGVCVGMQMMAHRSEEGSARGLGWFDADVLRLDESRILGRTHLPHMGWNDVAPIDEIGLFEEVGRASRFYFLHSYVVAPRCKNDVLATTQYGSIFACALRRQNIHGVQFHPEKSHGWGIQLLKNFAGL